MTELKHRRRDIQLASGQLLVASANLVRLLVLNPGYGVCPGRAGGEHRAADTRQRSLDDLLVPGLRRRPELASARNSSRRPSCGQASEARPFVPSVAVTYAGGGFGGGAGPFFGNFGPRGDAAASLFWELRNLGFGDGAIMNRRAA